MGAVIALLILAVIIWVYLPSLIPLAVLVLVIAALWAISVGTAWRGPEGRRRYWY